MLKFFVAVLLAFLMVSCGTETDALPEETVPAVEETAAETEPPEPEYLFESFFDAKKALFEAEELTGSLDLYEEDGINRFIALKQEMNDVLITDAFDQAMAEDYYVRLMKAKENLKYKQGDIPRVYIKTSGGHGWVGWGYEPCDIVIVSAEDEKYKVTEGDAEISLRGNSTAGAPKQPFNVRFDEKVSVLGMDKGRRWAFLANLYDKSLMRNYLAFYLGDKMGLPYSSKCRYADVYIDGQYKGNYTIVEPVTDGSGRVDIDTTDFEYIFEVDMNRNGCAYYINRPKVGQRFGVIRPETVTEEDKTYIKDFFDKMETALLTHDMAEYSQYIDVESFVNFYIHSEITKSIDVYDFSTKYFLKDGILYAGPIWDYDLAMGNVSHTCAEEKYYIYCNNPRYGTGSGDTADGVWMDNYWCGELLKDPEFKALVVERFEEVRPLIENIYQDNELGQNVIDWLMDEYGASFLRNYDEAGWDITVQYSGLAKNEQLPFLEEVEWLRDWFRRRTENVAAFLME